jgi:hypothetical protein
MDMLDVLLSIETISFMDDFQRENRHFIKTNEQKEATTMAVKPTTIDNRIPNPGDVYFELGRGYLVRLYNCEIAVYDDHEEEAARDRAEKEYIRYQISESKKY